MMRCLSWDLFVSIVVCFEIDLLGHTLVLTCCIDIRVRPETITLPRLGARDVAAQAKEEDDHRSRSIRTLAAINQHLLLFLPHGQKIQNRSARPPLPLIVCYLVDREGFVIRNLSEALDDVCVHALGACLAPFASDPRVTQWLQEVGSIRTSRLLQLLLLLRCCYTHAALRAAAALQPPDCIYTAATLLLLLLLLLSLLL